MIDILTRENWRVNQAKPRRKDAEIKRKEKNTRIIATAKQKRKHMSLFAFKYAN